MLANEPAVTAGQAIDDAATRRYDAAEMLNRHRHTTRTVAEHTLAHVLEARGAAQLLDAPDAWRLIDQTERATAQGMDPAAILAVVTDDQLADVEGATRELRQERLFRAGERPPYPALIAGLGLATSPATQPDVAALPRRPRRGNGAPPRHARCPTPGRPRAGMGGNPRAATCQAEDPGALDRGCGDRRVVA